METIMRAVCVSLLLAAAITPAFAQHPGQAAAQTVQQRDEAARIAKIPPAPKSVDSDAKPAAEPGK